MAGYLIRRLFQMLLVVLLATMAIYAILNLAPGGPLSGLNATADRKQRFSESDKARLEAYLGLDKPLVLRYIVWLLGDDWLGADQMYLGLNPPDGGRFYAASGVAYARGGYPLWVSGMADGTMEWEYKDGTVKDLTVIQATEVWLRPKTTEDIPEGAIEGAIIKVEGNQIHLDVARDPVDIVVMASRDTVWHVDIPARPAGTWVDVSWLFGPSGLLGRYANFHGNNHGVARFDWGTSWAVARGQPITMLIESRLGNTLLLMLTSTIISLFIAIPIGIYSAVKQYSKIDYVVTTLAFFGSAMPVFWLGIMLILVFSITFQKAGWPYLPAGGVTSVRTPPTGSVLALLNIKPGSTGDIFIHLLMPTAALSLLYMAGWSRYMRAAMLEVLRLDYVRTARAKGLDERMVIVKHAMRNALIPLVTIVVLQLPGLFGGAVLTETIFNWQGMGTLYFRALGADDWPVVMVLLYIQALLVVIATLAGDLLYTVVDPRIRYD